MDSARCELLPVREEARGEEILAAAGGLGVAVHRKHVGLPQGLQVGGPRVLHVQFYLQVNHSLCLSVFADLRVPLLLSLIFFAESFARPLSSGHT